MTLITPQDGETPLEALLRVHAKDAEIWEWNEDDFVPATPQEMHAGLQAAMKEARGKGWIPTEDPGCQCFTCRSFRTYIAGA